MHITRLVTRADGLVHVKDILGNRQFQKMDVSFNELEHIVRSNDKQRFEMVKEESSLLIELLSIDSRNGYSHSLCQL